ncbi:unnamed protein product [Mortierella alpina]
MDLATLSALDDMLSDVLLDQTHLWFTTHKMNEGYQPLNINPDDILTIIQRRVIVEKDLEAAVKDLVKIPVFDKVLVTKKQTQDFKSHAKKYFGMYLATAGFDISQTDRYTAVTKKSEACVIATRDFDEGAELAQCAGSTAALTEQQDGELESDFSVIRTSRRGTFLFLGPARFVNHDCDPNCRFMWANNTSICFRALRPIRTNDEITTSYGDSYFGINNRECLCATCESRGQGAYSDRRSGSESSASDKAEENAGNAPPSRSLRSRKAVDYCLRKKPTKQCPTPTSPDSSGGSESAPIPRKKKSTKQHPSPPSPTLSGGSDSTPDTPRRDSTDVQALVTPVPTPTRSLKIEFPPFTDDEDDGDDVDSAGPHAPATEDDVEYLFPIESEVEDRLLNAMKGFHITEPKGKEVVREYVDARNRQPASTSVRALQMTPTSSTTSPAVSSRNFRMSIDFLCSPPRDTDTEVQQIGDLSDTQNDVQESTSKVHTARTRTKSGKAAHVKEVDPDRCASCKTLTPTDQKDDSGDCRRCHRHLLLYGVAWPSRSKDALVAKFEQQEKQKRDALSKIAEDLQRIEKAEAAKAQAAAKAERAEAQRARKRLLAKESRARARAQAQAQAQAQARSVAQAQVEAQRQAETKAQRYAQAQAPGHYGFATAQAPHALLPAVYNAARLVNIRPKPAMGSSFVDVPSKTHRTPTSDSPALVTIRCPQPAMGSFKDVPSVTYHALTISSAAHVTTPLHQPVVGTMGDTPSGSYRPMASYDATQLASFAPLPAMGSSFVDVPSGTHRTPTSDSPALVTIRLPQPAMGSFKDVPSVTYHAPTTHSAAHVTNRLPQPALSGFENDPHGSCRAATSQEAAYLTNPTSQPAVSSSDDLLSGPYRPRPIQDLDVDVSTVITEEHPFHHAPYLVFVDPQDSSAKFWWIAVTVPRNQMDLSMPDIPTRPDGSIDPDLIIVRFLEDFKYAVCNISGLKLFLPDGPVYHGFVQSAGREFKKNLSVSRAFQFLDGHVPPNLRWRYMGFHLARPLSEIAGYVHQTEIQISRLLDEACQWELARVHTMNQQWRHQQREIQQLKEFEAQLELKAQQERQAQQEVEMQQDMVQDQASKRRKRRSTDPSTKRKQGGRGLGKKTLEKLRLEELERLRLEELDRMQHEELERVRLEELERTRLQELELERVRLEALERARLEALEKARLEQQERMRLEELERIQLEELERTRLAALANAEAELFDGPLSPALSDSSDFEDIEDVQEEDAQKEVTQNATHQATAPQGEIHLDVASQEDVSQDDAHLEDVAQNEVHMEIVKRDEEDVYQNEVHLQTTTHDETRLEDVTQNEVHLEVISQDEAHLEDVTQNEVHLQDISHDEAHLENVTQNEVHLEVIHQDDAHLEDVTQNEVHLEDINHDEAHLEDVTQNEVHLQDINHDDAHLEDVTQNEVHLEVIHQDEAHLEDITQNEVHLQDIGHDEAHLEDVAQNEVHLEDISQDEAHLEDVNQNEIHLEDINHDEAYAGDVTRNQVHLLAVIRGEAHLEDVGQGELHLEVTIHDQAPSEDVARNEVHWLVINHNGAHLEDVSQNEVHLRNLTQNRVPLLLLIPGQGQAHVEGGTLNDVHLEVAQDEDVSQAELVAQGEDVTQVEAVAQGGEVPQEVVYVEEVTQEVAPQVVVHQDEEEVHQEEVPLEMTPQEVVSQEEVGESSVRPVSLKRTRDWPVSTRAMKRSRQ